MSTTTRKRHDNLSLVFGMVAFCSFPFALVQPVVLWVSGLCLVVAILHGISPDKMKVWECTRCGNFFERT